MLSVKEFFLNLGHSEGSVLKLRVTLGSVFSSWHGPVLPEPLLCTHLTCYGALQLTGAHSVVVEGGVE